jgi:hypothetical protein
VALELGHCEGDVAYDLCGCYWRLVLRRVSVVFSSFITSFAHDLSPDVPIPLPSDTHIIHAALMRAAYPSLGSIVLSALILTGIRLLGLLTLALRWLPLYLPLVLRPWCQPIIFGSGMAVSYLESVTTSLSKYALVYTGLTGDHFFLSARRARALTAAVETASAGRYRKKFKTERAYCLCSPQNYN